LHMSVQLEDVAVDGRHSHLMVSSCMRCPFVCCDGLEFAVQRRSRSPARTSLLLQRTVDVRAVLDKTRHCSCRHSSFATSTWLRNASLLSLMSHSSAAMHFEAWQMRRGFANQCLKRACAAAAPSRCRGTGRGRPSILQLAHDTRHLGSRLRTVQASQQDRL